MAQILLDIPLIRESEVKHFISYMNELRKNYSEVSICRSLLEAVEREYISPNTLNAFVPWCKSLDTIVIWLNYQSSRTIRKLGIKNFGKALSDPEKWMDVWKSVGGTKGLVDLLAKISVTEVKALARAIGRCRGQRIIPAREKAIEELLRALLPSHYPESRLQSYDKRPIQEHYAQMVTACSSEFVAQLLDSQDQSNPLYRNIRATRLLKTHGELLQKRVIAAIFGQGKRDLNLGEYLEAFCYKQPAEPGPYPRVSAPMAFSMNVLKMRLRDNNNTKWPTQVSEANVFMTLLRKCIKKRLPEDKLRDIFTLGLKLLDANPKLKSAFKSSNLWDELITRWAKSPRDYEELLSHGLRSDLGGTSHGICQSVMQISKKFKLTPQRTWDLLRLYCLYVPKNNDAPVDLDTATDLKPLGKQQWSSELFYKLNKDQAIRLLKSLQISFPYDSFLQGPSETSILSGHPTAKQRNAALLSTLLQRESVEVQSKAKTTVDDLRKKAATSREQTDRAEFAIAASQHAIASGNLGVYGETVTWLQRYVRDPLTLKEVFGKRAVMTIEGIDLLSGIPDPLPENMKLEEVASKVEKANDILMTFHETMLIAKREPSFQQYDWDSVSSLFGAAIKRRVAHANAVQKRLFASDADIYAAIWGHTLAMLEIVDVKFLREAYQPIQDLVSTLPPTTLAATARSMLATGTERRKKKDRQPGDDLLESLSYAVLLRVAKGDKPELAQQLVLETILDRPDASSWHRQFLSPAFMKSLTAKQAHEMLLAFATAIGEKLEEQSYVKVGEAQPAASAPPQSLIKVTTIKYLAQLLDNADFISADAAIEVLVELFKAGTHRDIRLATLDSLLSLLNTLCSGTDEKWRSNPLVEKIMGALETVIPVVGSINERRPAQAKDWTEAQDTGKLPDVSDSSYNSLPPLMSAIFQAPGEGRYPGLENLRAEFVSRFFLPTYELLQKEHHKWLSLFLAKHKIDLEASDLPPVPVKFRLWDTLVRYYADLLPQKVLNDYNKYIIMTIARPATLQALNKSFKKDPELHGTPEVQHWLSTFGNSLKSYTGSGIDLLANKIYDDRLQSSISDGITYDKVQDMIISHASLLLDDYDKNSNIWADFTKGLRHPCKATFPYEGHDKIRSKAIKWQQTGRFTLERVAALVEDRKAIFTQQRNLTALPSATVLRHWLLPYPSFPSPEKLDGQCKLLAGEVEKQLVKYLGGEANVLRWPRIAEDAYTVSALLNTNEEKLRVASYIGKLIPGNDQKSSALNFVKMTLAMQLIGDGKEGFKKLTKKEVEKSNENIVLLAAVREIVQEWLVHTDEGIRENAVEWKKVNQAIWQKFLKNDGDGEVAAPKKGPERGNGVNLSIY